jgi:hypothetical protein
MARSVYLLAMLGLIWAAGAGRAQETYTIKLKEEARGHRHKVDKRITAQSTMKVVDSQGNPLQATEEDKTERFVYEEAILEKPEGLEPTHLRRRYEVAQVKIGTDNQTFPYLGKTVDIQKKGDRYHFRVEGGEELSSKDAQFLDKEFNKSKGDDLVFKRAILPRKPVRVMESWTMDTAALIADLQKASPFEIDMANAKTTATLLKAYKKDGHQFGVVKMKMVFPLKWLKTGEQKVSFGAGAQMMLEVTMDGCIDGSLLDANAVLSGSMTAQADLNQGGKKFRLTASMKMAEEEKDKELEKK